MREQVRPGRWKGAHELLEHNLGIFRTTPPPPLLPEGATLVKAKVLLWWLRDLWFSNIFFPPCSILFQHVPWCSKGRWHPSTADMRLHVSSSRRSMSCIWNRGKVVISVRRHREFCSRVVLTFDWSCRGCGFDPRHGTTCMSLDKAFNLNCTR